jgi:hypothetical protein
VQVEQSEIDRLLGELRNEETAVNAAFALSEIKDERVVEGLLLALDDPRPLVRNYAIFALAELASPQAIRPIARLLRDPDLGVRVRAAEALSRIGDSGVLPDLAEALVASLEVDAHLCRQLIVALADVGGAKAVDLILPAFQSSIPEVRAVAARFLGYVGDRQTITALQDVLRTESNEAVRAAVRDAMDIIAARVGEKNSGEKHSPEVPMADREVVALIQVSGGRGPAQGILAVWEDGFLVWSADPVQGGPPYLAGQQSPAAAGQAIMEMTRIIEIENAPARQFHYGPDSRWLSIKLYDAGQPVLHLGSWHELFEANPGLVVTETGVEPLGGRDRETVLAAQSAGYQAFRRRWQTIKERLLALVPAESAPYDPIPHRPLPW